MTIELYNCIPFAGLEITFLNVDYLIFPDSENPGFSKYRKEKNSC